MIENNIQFNYEPVKFIHEYSSTEFYYGVSNNGADTTQPIWKIRRITKVGDIWKLNEYPNGDQSFVFIWDNRLTYDYL